MSTDYGTDLACVSDFSDEFRESSGPRCLAEALVRRLMTKRGMVVDAPDYGTDLREYIGLEFTARNSARLISDVRNECVKDERVESVEVADATFAPSTRTVQLTIDVTSVIGATFTLTAVVSAISVDLLSP